MSIDIATQEPQRPTAYVLLPSEKMPQVLYDLCKAVRAHDDADAILTDYNNITETGVPAHILCQWADAYKEEQDAALRAARARALAKLTEEECKLLGLRK